MARFLLICLGGAAGTGARYLVAAFVQEHCGPGFPWGTFAVNAIGSFAISLLMHVAVATNMDETLRLTLITGVLGGFTTYSAFNYETLALFQNGAWSSGATNVAVTVVACLLAGVLGLATGRAIVA